MKIGLSGLLVLGSIACMQAQYEKNVGINISTSTATLHLKGKGSSNTTQSLKIENSTGTNLLTVNDDGSASGSVLSAFGGSSLPSQTNNAGKFLTTDGSNLSWGNVAGTSTPFKKITLAVGNNNYTVTTADLGGIFLFDWAAVQGNNSASIFLTLPAPATAGYGAKFRISYTSFEGGTNWASSARTPSGSLYAGNSPVGANTYVSGYFTSEFFCDGTNWYEIPQT